MWRAFLTALFVAQFTNAQDRPSEEVIFVDSNLLQRILLQDGSIQIVEPVDRKMAKRCRWKLCGAGRRFRYN